MVFLVGLGKLIKRIWKKKTYRWLSYAICIITFSTLYDYIHSIITHTDDSAVSVPSVAV